MSEGYYLAVSSPSIHAHTRTRSPSCHSQARWDLLHCPHTGFSSPHFILRFRHVMHPVRVRLNGPRLLSLSTLNAALVMVDRLSTSSACGRSSELLKGRRSSEAGRFFRNFAAIVAPQQVGFHLRSISQSSPPVILVHRAKECTFVASFSEHQRTLKISWIKVSIRIY